MQVTGLTNQGLERPRNEDNFFARATEDFALLVVADGMGGHRAGDVASALAVKEAENTFLKLKQALPLSVLKARSLLKSLVKNANRCILAEAENKSSCAGMGTTLTAALICGNRLTVAHVGDSRAYKIYLDNIYLLTKDHSLVEKYVDSGELSPQQALTHPQRHVLTRALGTCDHLKIDVIEQEIEPGSTLLLCTDGLTNMVGDEEILNCSRHHLSPSSLAQALIDLANERGGPDNITVVVARIGGLLA